MAREPTRYIWGAWGMVPDTEGNRHKAACRKWLAHITTTGVALTLALTLTACSTPEPGIEVRTVEVPVEVQRPCPATAPVRPAPLGPLPSDAIALAAELAAKLAEFSAPGKYADQVDAYVRVCPPSKQD